VERESLAAVAKELVNPTLLLHKDRSIKVASPTAALQSSLCEGLCGMLPGRRPLFHGSRRAIHTARTSSELSFAAVWSSSSRAQDIFAFMFRQLKNLGKSSGDKVHHQQYYYLLSSLSNAKSACLVCELANADEQICDAFKDFFDIVGWVAFYLLVLEKKQLLQPRHSGERQDLHGRHSIAAIGRVPHGAARRS
jgi:sister-chromatid-cohesion protein PDS5